MQYKQTPDSFRTRNYFRRRYDALSRKLGFSATDNKSWRIWRQKLRRKLKQLLGYNTMQKTPLKPRVTERIDCNDYIRERVEIQTEPGIIMPMFVLIPGNKNGPFPAVMAPHGHGGGGKVAVAGIRDNPEVASAIEGYNYDYGVQFVRAGFIVFCPDARGFGERRENPQTSGILDSSCAVINHMALPLGQTITGMWSWDLHRLIDYIEMREDCVKGRVGCAGLSGGGLQTLWAAALDDSITCAVISGYFYGCKESLLDMHENCSCNYVPHVWEYADMGDLGALIAPRPLLIETGNQDPLNGASNLKNVRSQLAITRSAYRLLGKPHLVRHDIFDGPHRWHGVNAIPWMKKWLS